MSYGWPGIQGTAECARACDDRRGTGRSDRRPAGVGWSATGRDAEALAGDLQAVERHHVLSVLEQTGWRIRAKCRRAAARAQADDAGSTHEAAWNPPPESQPRNLAGATLAPLVILQPTGGS